MPKLGEFVLHSRAVPPLTAGDYTLEGIAAGGRRADGAAHGAPAHHLAALQDAARSDPLDVPAGQREGAFEARLPQIVLKRRTLPWERCRPAPRATRRRPGSRSS